MKRVSLFVVTGLGALAFAMGCQAIADLQTRTLNPLPTVGCALPSTGNARVRLVNVANTGTTTTSPAAYSDFCIRPSGTSDWGHAIFREEGTDALCLGGGGRPGGLAYGQATVPFAVPVGKIDVKAIPSGQPCSADGTSEKDGIAVGDVTSGANPVVTLMRWGGGSSPEAITALSEEPANTVSADKTKTLVRPVNALSDNLSVVFGQSNSTALPATLSLIFNNQAIPPGGVLPVSAPGQNGEQVGSVDAQGYQGLFTQLFNIGFALSTDATENALTLTQTAQVLDVATFYVIGDQGDKSNQHPIRGLYCEDQGAAPASTVDAGVDAGAGTLTTLDDSLLANCRFAALPELSVDLANLSLYGADAPFESIRRPILTGSTNNPLAARTSDFMCLLEVDRPGDQQAIAAAALQGGQFPYSYTVTSTVSTPPSNPKDVYPLPQFAPCGGQVTSTEVTNVLNCAESKCDTAANDVGVGQGSLNGTAQCLSNGCVTDFAGLYTALGPGDTPGTLTYEKDSCFDCLLYYFTAEEPYASAQTNCANATQQPFAFDGATPNMILSHYKLNTSASAVYYLPTTGYRRAVLKVQAELEDQNVDFFCVQLISPFIDSSLPYTGNYGSDVLSDGGIGNGWEQEQDLQATEAVAWIQQQLQADGVAGIIAGDLHSSAPRAVDTGTSFVPAIPTGQAEACDECPASGSATPNPYNGSTPPYELMHAWTSGFPTNATVSETYWGNDNTAVAIPSGIPNQPQPPGGTGPLLEYAGHNYLVLRPTPK